MRNRTFVLAAVAAALLCLPAGAALAAPSTHVPTPVSPSDNGGDNGWGNCGHNSSQGQPHTGAKLPSGGNGGYGVGSDCAAVNVGPVVDPVVIVIS